MAISEITVQRITAAILNNPAAFSIIQNVIKREVRAELVALGLAEYKTESGDTYETGCKPE